MKIQQNYSLKKYNTFGITAKARYFASFSSESELAELLESDICKTEKLFILGGGSNILLTQDFNGIVLANTIEGIKVLAEDEHCTTIEVGAGEVWHDFVLWSIDKNLSGIENLALIPGLVGASPMQNIGAYGVELKDVVESVDFIEIDSGNKKTIENSACNFGYRDSIFKHELKGKVVITKVIFKLSKKPLNKTTYGTIERELKHLNLEANPKNIAQAVINIRNSKLPNPKVLGNSGSFFKNPVIDTIKFEELKKELLQAVRKELGPIAVISEVNFVDMLPKTRSGKIMRRVFKAVVLNQDPGDITTIEDEGSVEEARTAWEEMKKSLKSNPA